MNRYVFICITLAFFSAILFVADTNGAFEKSPHPIAYISESSRTVRRLPNNEMTWDRAREGTPLELGDTVSTGYRAQAKIVFKAGGILILDEGSMVVLSGNVEQLQLNFVTGGARLEMTKIAQDKIKVVESQIKPADVPKGRSSVEVSVVEDKVFLNLPTQESKPSKENFREVIPGMNQKTILSDVGTSEIFVFDQAPRIEWANNGPQEVYLYGTPKPSFKTEWRMTSTQSHKDIYFQLTIREEGNSLPIVVQTRNFSAEQIVPHDGIYREQVNLLSDSGVVLSSTEVKKVLVKMRPLLPAPQFSSRVPASVEASRAGTVEISWDPVAGAKAYVIQVKDHNNDNFRTEKRNETFQTVKGLLPGTYKIRLATIDAFDRMGAFGDEKPIAVPSH